MFHKWVNRDERSHLKTDHLKEISYKQRQFLFHPLPEQHERVRRVDALFAFADSIEVKVAAAREKTEKLRQSILAKAFFSELVEAEAKIARREGRDYESAEVLLERIKKERGKAGKKK